MITMRQYFAVVTFLAVCVLGITPIYRWWRRKEDAAEAKAKAARIAELDRQRREEARSHEVREERAYTSKMFRELRKAMDISPLGTEASQTDSAKAADGSSVVESAEKEAPDDPTEDLLDEALGPASSPNTAVGLVREQVMRGPIFKRPAIADAKTSKMSTFGIEETRSETRLVADRNFHNDSKGWVFIVHLPTFPNMADWLRPRAFGKKGFDWTKWIPFSEIPAHDVERALEAMEAWFLRLARGEEQPTNGRLTKSCAQWDDYEEDPKTQGYRVLWLDPRDE